MSDRVEVAPRESAAPSLETAPFDHVSDVVVVGGGGGGLPAALFSRWQGNEVTLLEKAPQLGGTANKAAFWYWVPNNAAMRAAGVADSQEAFVKYVARLSRPLSYDPDSPTYGQSPDEYAQYCAIYESASPATELLADKDALPYRACLDVPDYWSHIPEAEAPRGRVLIPRDALPTMSDGGKNGVRTMSAAAYRDGVDVRLSHRVQRLILGPEGRVVGVEATDSQGRTLRFGARKGVVFATGGYTHDKELRQNFLSVPVYGGCAAATNEGDFVRISSHVGAQLRNMNYAWMCPVSLEKAVRKDPDLSGIFSMNGDSMVMVDMGGRRVLNEKLPYNELATSLWKWDAVAGDYPNAVLVKIWDQRSQDHSHGWEYGRLIVSPGQPDYHVIKGATLEELAANISARLAEYSRVTAGKHLSPDFLTSLERTIERFNAFAVQGKDEDFHRGEQEIQLVFNGDVKDEPGRLNPTMWPISGQGPYYAALVTGGTLDTKGGPKTTVDAEVLDDMGQPIPGLYGVGNCVAASSAQAYWAGGATLGPIIAFAYRAANKVSTAQPVTLERK